MVSPERLYTFGVGDAPELNVILPEVVPSIVKLFACRVDPVEAMVFTSARQDPKRAERIIIITL